MSLYQDEKMAILKPEGDITMNRLSKLLALGLTLALSVATLLPVAASASLYDIHLLYLPPASPRYIYWDSCEEKSDCHGYTCYIPLSEEALALARAGKLGVSIKASFSCGTSRTFTRQIHIDDTETVIFDMKKKNYIVPATTYSYDTGIIQLPTDVLPTLGVRVHGSTNLTPSDLGVDFTIIFHDLSDKTTVEGAHEIYSDVKEQDYFCDSVGFVCQNQYMIGISDTRFAPAAPITRGQFVTTLQRLAGEKIESSHHFTDVEAGSYYEDAVIWATGNGIVNGVSDTAFDPNAPITREQMAAILFRYAQYQGIDTAVEGDLSAFADADAVSDYAAEAMIWANQTGLILGKKADILDPQGMATRGQTAVILHRAATNLFS